MKRAGKKRAGRERNWQESQAGLRAMIRGGHVLVSDGGHSVY